MPKTLPQLSPPKKPPTGGGVIAAGFGEEDEDDIRTLGDQIAGLTLSQAVELGWYLYEVPK